MAAITSAEHDSLDPVLTHSDQRCGQQKNFQTLRFGAAFFSFCAGRVTLAIRFQAALVLMDH